MNNSFTFYICPICFEISDIRLNQHQHKMLKVDLSKISDEDRKPMMDAAGRLTTAMARWFIQATTALHRQQALSA